jgi:hypothetical protein
MRGGARRTFAGRTAFELATAVQQGDIIDPPDPAHAPRSFIPILHRGLLAERDERWPSMIELLTALEQKAARARRNWFATLFRGGAIRPVE